VKAGGGFPMVETMPAAKLVMAVDRPWNASMSTSDPCASNWPCWHDCRHAEPLPADGWVWCSRDAKAPRHRTVRLARECRWFSARAVVKAPDLLTRAAEGC